MENKPQSFRMMERHDAGIENTPIKVIAWYMLKNGWEVYEVLTAESHESNAMFTLTLGEELEFGFHMKSDIEKNTLVSTTDLHEVAPPPGWRWVGVH